MLAEMIVKVREYDTKMIKACIYEFGNRYQQKKELAKEDWLVRSALLFVYHEREGDEAVDRVMDAIEL